MIEDNGNGIDIAIQKKIFDPSLRPKHQVRVLDWR
jgi:signal transduction histidine kinase